MKSPLVQNSDYIKDSEKGGYSDLQVLKSNAGFYIGTIYKDPETGWEEPGSRDSGYYSTKELAQEALDNQDWEQRTHP